MMNRNLGITTIRTAAAVLLCGTALWVAGCSSTSEFAGHDSVAVAGAAVKGTVYGGQQPIIGATVQLWAVGTGGYGSAATALGSPVTTLSPGGTFTIGAYTCPTGS